MTDKSTTKLFIKGGKIVNDDQIFTADISIENGIITNIGQNLTIPNGAKVIDSSNKFVIPGGIDTHTRLQYKILGTCSSDDFFTGTKAALSGGTTTIIDYVSCQRGNSLITAYDQIRIAADSKVCCDYALHVIVPQFNNAIRKEMETLVKDKGINTFEAFLACKDLYMLEDDEFYDMLRYCRQIGALVQVHAENGKVIDRRAEELISGGVTGPEGHYYSRPDSLTLEATQRAISLAALANCPLYVGKVMNQRVAQCIAEARRSGSVVFGEPIVAGLACDASHYFNNNWRHAAGYVMSPPLSADPNTGEQLMRSLACGDLEFIGSDHCVFRAEQKALGKEDFRKIPSGANGVEDRLSVVWQLGVERGILDPCQFVAVTSSNAAKVFNLYPRKGRVAVGSDADLVIWDANAERVISARTHLQNVDFNIFEGMRCRGVAHTVIQRGNVVMENANTSSLKVTQGAGRFLSTAPHCRYVYGRVDILEKFRSKAAVKREPFTGAVLDLTAALASSVGGGDIAGTASTPGGGTPRNEVAATYPQRGGNRNMQESSFNLSGQQLDDKTPPKSSIRTNQPPGGASSGIW